MADKPDRPKIPDRPHDWVEWANEQGPLYVDDLDPADRAELEKAMKAQSLAHQAELDCARANRADLDSRET